MPRLDNATPERPQSPRSGGLDTVLRVALALGVGGGLVLGLVKPPGMGWQVPVWCLYAIGLAAGLALLMRQQRRRHRADS
jgi:hypothetical protein